MLYFRELPDLEYQSPLTERISSTQYVRVKNIFRRLKIRDDLKDVFVLFNKYIIPDGARPDTVAEELYGKPELDWIVLTVANITNVRNQWPLNTRDLYRFCENKYGTNLNSLRFYETTEVRDSKNRLILPPGKVVDGSFTITNPDSPEQTLNPVTGISNYEYETRLNEEKRKIDVLKRVYLQQVLSDARDAAYYTESSQYVDRTLIRTENTRNTML